MSDELIELPEGWELTTLGELGEWSSGGTPSRKKLEYYGGDIPWIKTGDLTDGIIEEIEETITQEGLTSSSAKIFPTGSLVVAMYGATIGKLGILKEDAATNQACGVLKLASITEELISYLFYYLLRSREDLRMIGQGGAQPNISQSILKDYSCPLPPLNEQKRIVAKIEELRERSQKARSHLSAIPNLCDKFRQSVLAAAFRGDLTADWREQNPDVEPASMLSEALKRRSSQLDSDLEEYDLLDLPDSWIWVNIDSISDVKGGKRLPKGEKLVENDTGYPYIKAGNLKNGTVTLDDIEYIPTRIQPLIKNYVVAAGDVYITIVGACIGDAGTICKELDGANLTENAAKISNLSNANNEYLALWLRSPLCQKIIKTKILSAAQGKLALTRIKTIPVPLAPIQEQSEIVTKSADILKSSDQTTELYEKIQSNLDWLDRSILAKAFRGELVEQDPNDEPASILLERIRAEREQQTQGNAKKPGKKGQRTIKTDPP